MKTRSKKTIIVLGDSFIYGHGCKDRIYHTDEKTGETFGKPENLLGPASEYAWASLLQKDHPNLVDVYNVSLPGLDVLSLVSGLANLLDGTDIKPDLIIHNSCPPGRLILKADQNLDGTPYLNRIINLSDYDKSGNWAVFRQALPIGLNHAISGGHGAFTNLQNDGFIKFAGTLYHDALSVQMAISAMLANYAIAKTMNSKFIWASNQYCPAMLNHKGLIPKETMEELKPNIIPHIYELQRSDRSAYTAIDDHSNEQCHDDYYRTIIKPKIADLFR